MNLKFIYFFGIYTAGVLDLWCDLSLNLITRAIRTETFIDYAQDLLLLSRLAFI